MTEKSRAAEGVGGTGAKRASPHEGTLGPTGYGQGPKVAASVALGGALLFAGWGVTQLVFGDGATAVADEDVHVSAQADPTPEPDREGEVTITLPDKDGNGVPDELEKPLDVQPAKPEEPETYIIQTGDTLTAISGQTGVPVGHLVEVNKIQNPDLIYAGAALLLPPV